MVQFKTLDKEKVNKVFNKHRESHRRNHNSHTLNEEENQQAIEPKKEYMSRTKRDTGVVNW